MKKVIFMLVCLTLATTATGQATNWSTRLKGRPTSDWFSASNSFRNVPLQWMREADLLLGASATGSTGGNVYVDSGVTTAGDGSNWDNAVATIDEGVALCTANDGWTIHVKEGHAETLAGADGVDVDIAGITIIGYGAGTGAPELTFSATGSEFVIGAANVTVVNLRFIAGISAITMGISVEDAGDYFTLVNCVFPKPTTNSWEFVDAIDLASGVTYISVLGNYYQNDDAGAAPDHFIDLGNALLVGIYIANNTIFGDFAVSAIWSNDADTEVYIYDNVITNQTADQHCIEFTGAATGVCAGNLLFTSAEATTLDPGSLNVYENFITTTTDVSGQIAFRPDNGINQLNATTITAIGAGVTGMGFRGTGENNAGTSTIISGDLSGFGDDYFNTGWSATVILDFSGAGSVPEGETRDITDYVSSTGTFTVDAAFTAAVTTSDEVYIRTREELNVDDQAMLNTSGTTWYLDDGGSNGDARSWQSAATTLAVVEALLSAGDTVFVGKNHNENITTSGDTIDVVGVTFIGMGEGNNRPLFDMDADSDEITLSAAGITLKNLRFRPGATTLTSGIRVEAAGIGCTIEDCAFVDGEAAGTDEWVDAISVDTLASDLTVRNTTFYNTGAPGSFVNLDEATIANTTVVGCTMFGACTEAPIWGAAAIPTNLNIRDNVVKNTSSGNLCIEFTGAATGECLNNTLSGDTYGAILDPGSMRCYNNKQTVGVDTGGIDVPLVPGQTYAISTPADEVTANLFDVQGGEILIYSCVGLVDVVIGGGATNAKLEVNADDGAAWDRDFTTSVGIAGDIAGTIYVFTAANAAVLDPRLGGATEGTTNLMSPWFCPEGMILQTMDADPGGAGGDHITWYITFTPLTDGVTVVPQ